MPELLADVELDARGLFCPEPVMLLHGKVRDLHPGGVIRMLATDRSTMRDLPKFCVFLGHELLAHEDCEGVLCFWIKVGGGAAKIA